MDGHIKVRLLVAAGCLLALPGAALAQGKITLTVGHLLELTGPMSASGPAMAKTSKLAIEAATQAAKDAGIDLELNEVTTDTQGDPQAALSAARQLVEKGATCLVGPSTTPESIAIANGLTIRRKITLWPTASSTRLRTINDEGTIFRTVPPDDRQAIAVANAAEITLGSAKDKVVSVGYRNEPYGEGLAKSFSAAWQEKGGKIQGPVVFDPNQASFDSEANQIVSNNPDAYMIVDYPDSFVKMSASLLRTGKFDPKKLFVTDTISFAEVPRNIPAEALEGAKGARAGTDRETGRYKMFEDLWKKAGGVDHYSLDANQFDATLMCVLAAVAAKSSDPAKMQAEFRKVAGAPGEKYDVTKLGEAMKALLDGKDIDFEGVSGPLDLAPNGDPVTSLYDIFEYRNAKLVVVRQIDAKK